MKYVNRCALFVLVSVCWGSVFCAAEREVKDDGQVVQHVPKKPQGAKKPQKRHLYYLSQYGTGREVEDALRLKKYPQDVKNHALRLASKYGTVKSVSGLIVAGAQVNASDVNGTTAFHVAAKPSIIQRLADSKADIERADNKGRRALHYALMGAWHETYGVVEKLLDIGVAIDVADSEGMTPLLLAKDKNLVKRLLVAKAPVDTKGPKDVTALHLACERGDLELVMLLLEHKAPVDAPSSRNTPCCAAQPGFVTPLFLAARNCPQRNGDIEKRKQYAAIMRALVARGASTKKAKMYDWCYAQNNFMRYDVLSMMQDEGPKSQCAIQ